MNVSFKLLEVGGIFPSITGMRLPTKSKGDTIREIGVIGVKDKQLASNLICKGTVHGKFQRGVQYWFEINMPRSIWSELDTYVIGMSPISSESTMYTLTKECAEITSDMFVEYTPKLTISDFKSAVTFLSDQYGGRKNIPIHILKSALPEGWLQKRNRVFSAQALKGMYRDRRGHRMPEWVIICSAIEQLPYFNELIIGCETEDFE